MPAVEWWSGGSCSCIERGLAEEGGIGDSRWWPCYREQQQLTVDTTHTTASLESCDPRTFRRVIGAVPAHKLPILAGFRHPRTLAA